MTKKQVPVFTKSGELLGYVSGSATSIAAVKLAANREIKRAEFSQRFGEYGWIVS